LEKFQHVILDTEIPKWNRNPDAIKIDILTFEYEYKVDEYISNISNETYFGFRHTKVLDSGIVVFTCYDDDDDYVRKLYLYSNNKFYYNLFKT
jgi:hypothetical protein